MSLKLNKSAYEKMIKENLEWLERQPNTLENAHIKLIVERSADHEYRKADELIELREFREKAFKAHPNIDIDIENLY